MNPVAWTVVGLVLTALTTLAYWVGRERGRDDIRDKIERDSEQAEKDRDKIDKDVANRPNDQLDRDLDPWMRD